MSVATRSSLWLIAALLLAVAAIAAVLLLSGSPRERQVASAPDRVEVEPAPVELGGAAPLEVRQPGGVEAPASEFTTVIWPLEVELTLLTAARLPILDGGQPTSLGRGAALVGSILDRSGAGVDAEVHFVAGPNAGRTLFANSDGQYGASDLYPGLQLVEINDDRGRIIDKRREVRLRRGATTDLHVSDFRPATVYGTVRSADGPLLEGAEVSIDGRTARTDVDGTFYFPEVAGGKVLVEVSAEGFAPYREEQHITIGTTYTPDKFAYVLRPGAVLELSLPDAVGGPGDAYVLVYPTKTNVARTYPWHSINPVRMAPGTTRRIEGLPPGMVSVRAFHSGAIASPEERAVNLRAGEEHQVSISFRPAPILTGIVRRDGEPVPFAPVRLEAPDRTMATLNFFRDPSPLFLESEILAPIPLAVQEVTADSTGRFVLTSWADELPTRWLEASSADGEAWAGRLVHAEENDVVLDLVLREASGVLTIQTTQRRQGLDLHVSVNGEQREPQIGLPSWEPIRIGGLEPGTWRLRIVFDTAELLAPSIVEIPALGGLELRVDLPLEAIEGQTRAEWRQAGRSFPE